MPLFEWYGGHLSCRLICLSRRWGWQPYAYIEANLGSKKLDSVRMRIWPRPRAIGLVRKSIPARLSRNIILQDSAGIWARWSFGIRDTIPDTDRSLNTTRVFRELRSGSNTHRSTRAQWLAGPFVFSGNCEKSPPKSPTSSALFVSSINYVWLVFNDIGMLPSQPYGRRTFPEELNVAHVDMTSRFPPHPIYFSWWSPCGGRPERAPICRCTHPNC